eukprot:TRINITY_DN26678_c0_g2_i1.p1 TRINITY_DN26678_c0_g2~~TRINITY_DN26678_c0_g2_i1.p1  ORF type:complete len:312 (-),score=75.76 TRINITY_DN26678_c0_g2_i1:201-1136(-)
MGAGLTTCNSFDEAKRCRTKVVDIQPGDEHHDCGMEASSTKRREPAQMDRGGYYDFATDETDLSDVSCGILTPAVANPKNAEFCPAPTEWDRAKIAHAAEVALSSMSATEFAGLLRSQAATLQVKPHKLLAHHLIVGARDGNPELVRAALAAGAKVDARPKLKMVLGEQLAQHMDLESQQKAAEKSEKTSSGSSKRGLGLTPLMYAAKNGNLECLKLLLGGKASFSAADEDGMQALHFAALSGDVAIAEALIQAGADCQAMDDMGRRPLDLLPEDIRKTRQLLKRWTDLCNGNISRPITSLQPLEFTEIQD